MKLNPSIKHHLIIGAFIGVWGFIFAFFARPFEHGTMDLRRWIEVSVGFSLLEFFAYALVSWVQNRIFQRSSKWTVLYEISMYALFYAFYTITTYFYYKSSIIQGFYDFPKFFREIIVNLIIILTPIIAIARHYSLKLIPSQKEERKKGKQEEKEKYEKKQEDIVIKGANKLDFLKIKQSELVCISNTQNYVEVFYLENGELKIKLIRSSLKKLLTDFNFLVQIHRSHLINPHHFKSWKDSNTIVLTQKELPVSKTYKNDLISLQKTA